MFKSKKIALVEENILKNYNKYFRLAFSYIKNEDDAMDIVQEASYKAIKNASKLKNAEYIETWIYRIVINECKNFITKNKNNFQNIEDIEIGIFDTYKNLDLKAMLNILDEEERSIVALRYFEDLKIKDIAQIFSINENTIKSKLYRSLKKLERWLKND